MDNNKKQNVKEIVTWYISVNWYGKWRNSPEYPTKEAALAAMGAFLEKFDGKYLNVTFARSLRYVAE